MARLVVPAADALIDQEMRVLDHGFVRLVDYLGGDDRIVQAARVSYGSGTKSIREDASLIRYLMRHGHTSPFEQVVLTFHVKMPVFVARQWVRHRTARINEVSARYSVLPDTFYLPELGAIRAQSKRNKQGRDSLPLSEHGAEAMRESLERTYRSAYTEYEKALEAGVARELARLHLPVGIYTEMYWQIDLHNLFHFLKLRLDYHAQDEIRAYGTAISGIARAVAPVAYDAFEEYILEGVTLSKSAAARIRKAISESDLSQSPEQIEEILRLLGETK